jgi:hypothetical protein
LIQKDLIGGEYILGSYLIAECGITSDIYLANKVIVNKSKEAKLWLCFHRSIIEILSLALFRGYDCFTTTYLDLTDNVDGDISGKIKSIVGVLHNEEVSQYVTVEKVYFLQYLQSKPHDETGFPQTNLEELAINSDDDKDKKTNFPVIGEYIEQSED